MQGWHANSWSVPYFWMDKEVVVHIHNGILLSHIKEHIWVSCDDVDEPRTYYTEWNVSERERWISYSDSYIQNIEKWYWRIYLQGSSGETDIENRLMDLGIGKERVICMERVTWKLTLPYAKWIANGNLVYGSGKSNRDSINLEGWDREGDGKEFQKQGMYVYLWLIHFEVWQKTTKFCKAIILQ